MKAIANRLAAWIAQVLAADGGQSSTRLLLLSVWLAVLGVWTVLSLAQRAMAVVPESVLAMLGMATGAKVAQHITESATTRVSPG